MSKPMEMRELIKLCQQGDKLIDTEELDSILFTSRNLVIFGHERPDSYRDDLKIVIEDDGQLSLFYRKPGVEAWSGGWKFVNYEDLCGKAYCL